MSKIGKKPIDLLEGVTVEQKDGGFKVGGKLGTLNVRLLPGLRAEIKDNQVLLTAKDDLKQTRANWGTMAALLKNAINGVTTGFKKELEIQGVGFKANLKGKILVLNVGFSHPIEYNPPEGVAVTVEKSIISVSGLDRALVGQVAAEIRDFKKPEPYQGKGIRYMGEHVRRKQGKKVAGATA